MGLYPVCQTHWPRLGSAALRHIFFVSNKKQTKTNNNKTKKSTTTKQTFGGGCKGIRIKTKIVSCLLSGCPGLVAENYTKKQKRKFSCFCFVFNVDFNVFPFRSDLMICVLTVLSRTQTVWYGCNKFTSVVFDQL